MQTQGLRPATARGRAPATKSVCTRENSPSSDNNPLKTAHCDSLSKGLSKEV